MFNNMTIWLPPEKEPEFIGTENLARVFHDCEVGIFSLVAENHTFHHYFKVYYEFSMNDTYTKHFGLCIEASDMNSTYMYGN